MDNCGCNVDWRSGADDRSLADGYETTWIIGMTLGSHQTPIGKSQDWITPKWIIDALGPFDLDPCASSNLPPWACALHSSTSDGLDKKWWGRVWLNPPYHRYQIGKWIKRLAEHGTGTALLHARTETDWFEYCWRHASGILFLASRIHFYYPDGTRAKANSGAPACLVAFGTADADMLAKAPIAGVMCREWEFQSGRCDGE